MPSVLLDLPGLPEARGGLWYSTSASTRFGQHHHRELELNILVTGAARYGFPHRELRVSAPAALWIPPFVEHELLETSPELSMWVYSFRAPESDVLGGPRATLLGSQLPSKLQSELQMQLQSELLSAACQELKADGPRVTGIPPTVLCQIRERSREGLLRPELAQFNGILAEIFAAAWSARCPLDSSGEPAVSHPAARRAARWLREPGNSCSMAELARGSSLSRERLSRVFAQCFGIGLVQYRNHHRVQQFIHDYGHGSDSNMLRAAFDVGFGSYVQFHRAFKQVVGHPPAHHLALVREGVIDPARTGGSNSPAADP
ncbi:MAG: hypothetical protein RL685_4656 [Pseudomonadota bacterium]|jgi:AraC-like DNA-binding protein